MGWYVKSWEENMEEIHEDRKKVLEAICWEKGPRHIIGIEPDRLVNVIIRYLKLEMKRREKRQDQKKTWMKGIEMEFRIRKTVNEIILARSRGIWGNWFEFDRTNF